MKLEHEIARRRTFAIISHPDAGKTTLTEKFLLYGGALHLAGSVKARKHQRDTASDWMELERQRGISISSTVLQFDYRDCRINLLDTPGHKDFSEDTYRVLTAVDAVIMVIDAAKGIESQTLKLFEVCSRRGVPIFTFMNKVDRPTREPLDLLDELERVLGLGAFPMNWPLGTGGEFRGIYDRLRNEAHFFERTPGGAYRAPVAIGGLDDPMAREKLPDGMRRSLQEELEMLDLAGENFDPLEVRKARTTPVFFGSALNNFGVQLLLDAFLEHSVAPAARHSRSGPVPPNHEKFSGFVFKIQANMDPRHRDRIAFVRICSGWFRRDMTALHARTGKRVRLSNSQKMFGQDRETLDEACAGDVIGLVGHSEFGIGDTLTEDPDIVFHDMPRFPPECFVYLHGTESGQFKRFQAGLDQLLQEGVVQRIDLEDARRRTPLLAAVGPLQFEVVQHRLKNEYGADTRVESAPWSSLRWMDPEATSEARANLLMPTGARMAKDSRGQPVVLFSDDWSADYFQQKNPEIRLARLPFDTPVPAAALAAE